jgi:hypothetical protein
MLRECDVLIEFYRIGGYVKVSALDPRRYTEICTLGDPAAGAEALRRAAVQNLKRAVMRARPANRRR